MKIRMLLVIGLAMFNLKGLVGQTVSAQILDAYFTTLTRHHQLNREISEALQRISPDLQQTYLHLLNLEDKDGTLPWAYFQNKLERTGATDFLLSRCEEMRKLDALLRKYHDYRMVDPFSQTTVDTSQAMQRLLFFDLKKGEKVAEIGFGYGFNLHLLAMAYEELEIFANELSLSHLKRMERTIVQEYPSDRQDNFHFVAGAPSSTKLEGMELDLIIMENVLHHIEAQGDFVQSMLESLAPDGEIVIIEEFLGVNTGERGHCPDLMERDQLEKVFSAAGLRLQGEQQNLDQFKTMLRWRRNEAVQLEK